MAGSPLDRGSIRIRLLRELMSGERTQAEIAERYGYNPATISAFAKRHAATIAKMRDDENYVAYELWIADRELRLAEYEELYRRTIEALDKAGYDPNAMRVAMTALRSAAEEMGHLRLQADVGVQLNYKVDGVDMSKLT